MPPEDDEQAQEVYEAQMNALKETNDEMEQQESEFAHLQTE